MSDNGVKVYSYENSDFVEVPDTYYSVDSNDITFIKNKRIFKIEIPENVMAGSKRKMEDAIYIDDDESAKRIKTLEEINKKHVDDKIKYMLSLNKIERESKLLIENLNKLKEERDEAIKESKKNKIELLNARIKIEESVSEKKRAITLCNKMRLQLTKCAMEKK